MKGENLVPLAVDLDGTLIVEETHRVLAQKVLLSSLRAFAYGMKSFIQDGRNGFKYFCAEHAQRLNVSWTVREPLVHWLKQEKSRGRIVLLVTGAPDCIAQSVIQKLNLFDDVWTSTREVNLVGSMKAERLQKRFGCGGFDYIGNSWQDRPVWHLCRNAYIVTTSPLLKLWAQKHLDHSWFWTKNQEFERLTSRRVAKQKKVFGWF